MEDKEKMIEIARYHFPADAQTLISYLKAEGIDCYLRNEVTSGLMSYLDVGGARVEVLERNAAKAFELMEEGGFLQPIDDTTDERLGKATTWMQRVPGLRSLSLNMQIIVFIILVMIGLALLVVLGHYLSGSDKLPL